MNVYGINLSAGSVPGGLFKPSRQENSKAKIQHSAVQSGREGGQMPPIEAVTWHAGIIEVDTSLI